MAKIKRWLLGTLSVTMAAAALCGLVACGDGETGEEPGGDDSSTPSETVGIAYQFTGNYTDETLTSLGYDYYIILNLYEDGSVAGSGYNIYSMDSSAYASNSGFYEKWWKGTWEETENEEGLECIALSVSYDSDAVNIMGGGLLTGSFSYELFKDSAGVMTFTIDCPIYSGRTTIISGSEDVKYETLDEFIQGSLYVFSEPEYIAMFQSGSDSLTSRLYCQEDGTALFYSGTEDPATGEIKYLLSETWTWTYADGSLTFKQSDTVTLTATVSGASATVEYTKSLMGYEMSYSMTCSDISSLIESGGASADDTEQPEAETIAVFTNDDGATLTVKSDGTAQLSAYNGMISPDFTWTYSDGLLVFTDVEQSEKTYTATIDGNSASLTYEDSLGGYTITFILSCDDISGITG